MSKHKRASRSYHTIILIGIFVGILLLATVIVARLMTTPTTLLQPPLKELADKHQLQIGNFAIASHLHETQYTDILTGQFHFALADNTPNWYFTDGGLRPSRDSYNFTQMDQVVGFAESHHMAIQSHHYVWGEPKWLPDWLKNGNYSKEELLQIIREHIATVGKRYQGRIREWTVVNEAFSRGLHTYDLRDWWGDHVGDQSYIDEAFIAARAADPTAKLILNDFGNESDTPTARAMYDYVHSAKARGVPIDGIGLQMHLDARTAPSKDAMINQMKKFASLGVDIYVTEFDVNTSGMYTLNMFKDKRAGEIYYDATRACIESHVCHSFAQLGITDKETWYNYMGPDSWNARPLMFDEHYVAKPAYYEFRRALEEK